MIFSVENKKIFKVNSYIITDNLGNGIIIDPGLDEAAIEYKLNNEKITPLGIIVTHGHFDHIGSVAYFQSKYKIPYCIHREDVRLSRSANFFLKIGKYNFSIETPVPDIILQADSGELKIGTFDLNYYNVKGHSDGGIVIEHDNTIFTGDMLYKKNIGLNESPHEDKDKLRKSILKIFGMFNEKYKVYPGHGEMFVLGDVIRNNKELVRFLNEDEKS